MSIVYKIKIIQNVNVKQINKTFDAEIEKKIIDIWQLVLITIPEQTSDNQWSYNVKGALPDYQPPRGVSAPPIAGPHPPVKSQSGRKNYVRENLKLLTTAVSSPVKGGHLMQITKAHG